MENVVPLDQWEICQQRFLKAYLQSRLLHADEIENYNSFLSEILEITKEHFTITFIDKEDRLHVIQVHRG